MKWLEFKKQTYTSQKNRIVVPKDFYYLFKPIEYIRHGENQLSISLLVHQKNNDTIYISQAVKDALNLTEHDKAFCHFHGNILLLNPTVGVYTACFQKNKKEPIGPRTPIYEKICQAGIEHGMLTVFFGYQHVDIQNSKITGLIFESGQWLDYHTTIPSVIYDRIPNRRVENNPKVRAISKELKQMSNWFNHGFFNKWKIHDRLRKCQNSAPYLPETTLHPSKGKIIKLLHQEKAIYIKPVNGSKGNGILRCSFDQEQKELICSYYSGETAHQTRFLDFEAFFQQHFPNGLYGYIVQPDIDLLKKGSTPMDFRVHTNKNEQDQWEMTALCAKFAGKGSLTTHVKRGGTVHSLSDFFPKDEGHMIFRKLEKAALTVSKDLEKTTKQLIGEIGFDFGIDMEGRVWLFEANSKPGFAIFDHPKILEEADRILSYPHRYAKFLMLK